MGVEGCHVYWESSNEGGSSRGKFNATVDWEARSILQPSPTNTGKTLKLSQGREHSHAERDSGPYDPSPKETAHVRKYSRRWKKLQRKNKQNQRGSYAFTAIRHRATRRLITLSPARSWHSLHQQYMECTATWNSGRHPQSAHELCGNYGKDMKLRRPTKQTGPYVEESTTLARARQAASVLPIMGIAQTRKK